MLGRSKLRHILSKHQEEMQKNKMAKAESVKNINSNENEKFNNNINNLVKGRSTPIITTTPFFHINKIDDLLNLKIKNNERAAEMDYKNMDIFHRAVYPILIIGQCFAVMPVTGVSDPNPRHLRFSFKSLQMLVTLLFMPACAFLMISTLKHLLPVGINAKNLVGLVFFGCVQCACVLFLSLAPKWPSLIRYWTKTELIFTRKPYEQPKRNLAKRVRLAAVVIILLSIIEHGLFLSSAVYSFMQRTQICGALLNTTSTASFEKYMLSNYDYVFTLIPYYTAVGVLILLVNGACTFIWNYMDLFIVMISMGIAYRFEQIAVRINKLADKEVPEAVFIEIREHYVKVCELLEYVDEKFASIILLSCMNNLYFVCYQLLNIFNKLRWPINYIYFWYSLLYLMGRTAFVFLTAASINDESKSSLGVLRRLSLKTWCIEVERLTFQMTTQTVALSGKKFYFMTRRLLFGMAGTIVTYELVLLQFDEPNRSKGLQDLCA